MLSALERDFIVGVVGEISQWAWWGDLTVGVVGEIQKKNVYSCFLNTQTMLAGLYSLVYW